LISIHFEGWKVVFRAKGPEFVLPAVKTQNDARGATFVAPARQNHFVTDCKSPKLPILPTACEGTTAAPRACRPFVQPSDMG